MDIYWYPLSGLTANQGGNAEQMPRPFTGGIFYCHKNMNLKKGYLERYPQIR